MEDHRLLGESLIPWLPTAAPLQQICPTGGDRVGHDGIVGSTCRGADITTASDALKRQEYDGGEDCQHRNLVSRSERPEVMPQSKSLSRYRLQTIRPPEWLHIWKGILEGEGGHRASAGAE